MTHYPLILTPRPAPEVRATYQNHRTTNTSSFSFSSVDFDVDNANRVLVVGVHWFEFDTSAIINSISVGGVTPTLVASSSRLVSGGTGSFIYTSLYRVVVSGDSGTVSISFNRSVDYGCSIGVWSVYNLASATPVTTSSGDPSRSVSTLPGDVVISVATGVYDATNATWTGVTEDYDSAGNRMIRTGGSIISETNGALTVNAAPNAGNATMTVAVWR